MKKITLIDGNSIMFRAYYATAYPGAKIMQSSSGVFTNAVFAFSGMFDKILEIEHTDVLVAFDTAEPTKRHLSYEGYKAGRQKMPEELAQQIPLVYEYVDLHGVKRYSKGGYEADDIIGTIAKQASLKGYDVNIYSSDKDMLQLVDHHVTVNLLKKGMQEVHAFTPEKLVEVYGLTHDQMIDLKALMGDPSDNIPGIPGVGEKTAIKLLQEYQTLENILSHQDDIKGKLGEKIRAGAASALMSQDLVTIDKDADIDVHLDNIKREPVNTRALVSFLQNLDLHVLIKRIDEPVVIEDWDFQIIDNEHDLERVLTSKMAVFVELSDYNYHKAALWGVGLSDGKHHYFLPEAFALSSIGFQTYLSDQHIEKFTYDYKASKVFFMWQGNAFEGVSFDLLLAAYLLNSHIGKEEFKRIASTFHYEDVLYEEQVYGKGAKKGLPEDENLFQRHIVSKAKAIYQLKDQLLKELDDQAQRPLFDDIEMPLSDVLADMEYRGLHVDVDELKKQGDSLLKRIDEIEREIHQMAGEDFKVNSPKQLGDILFDKLGLPNGKKTKTGYSTNADVLNSLKDKHPIVGLIMDYRQLTKLHSTYIIGIEQNLFDDGKVHTIYNQALTTTGRLSSLDPNLQNIPIRTEEGRQIRKMFIPKKDRMFLGADYSQIELRVLASVANVKQLIEAFEHHEDIHTKTAKAIFHADTVDSNMRRVAKAVNFGIIYGIGAWSLSEDINVTPKEAQHFIDSYLELYPEIKAYMTDIVKFAYDHTYVETIMKRRRYIPELQSTVFTQRAFGERTALNAPIQGSAADILKKAMIDLYKYLKKNHKQSKILLQVHDELILEVTANEQKEMEEVVPKMMAEAVKLKVTLETSCDVGKTWYDLK